MPTPYAQNATDDAAALEAAILAQSNAPPPPPPVPIDGGLVLLGLAGAGLAARKLRQRSA